MKHMIYFFISIFIVTHLYSLENTKNIQDEVKEVHKQATCITKNVQSVVKGVVSSVGESAQNALDGIKEEAEKAVAIVADSQNRQELNMIRSLLEAASRRCEAYQSSLKEQHKLTELVKITMLCTAIKAVVKIAHTMN